MGRGGLEPIPGSIRYGVGVRPERDASPFQGTYTIILCGKFRDIN